MLYIFSPDELLVEHATFSSGSQLAHFAVDSFIADFDDIALQRMNTIR